jgi:hypothetical protein
VTTSSAGVGVKSATDGAMSARSKTNFPKNTSSCTPGSQVILDFAVCHKTLERKNEDMKTFLCPKIVPLTRSMATTLIAAKRATSGHRR